jgi:hypothetical protein
MEAVKAHVLSLVTAVAGLLVGFGFIGTGTEGTVIGVGGIAVGAIFQVCNALHVKVNTGSATAIKVAQIANGVSGPEVQSVISTLGTTVDALDSKSGQRFAQLEQRLAAVEQPLADLANVVAGKPAPVVAPAA